jgi:hypothetical protein
MKQPSPEECDSNADITNWVGSDTWGDRTFASWHPQWGGYVGRCIVHTLRVMSDGDTRLAGCFDVYNFHDGEFPSDKPTTYHYCAATQLIDFALTVLEKQLEGVDAHGRQRALSSEWIARVTKRFDLLLAPRESESGDCAAEGGAKE